MSIIRHAAIMVLLSALMICSSTAEKVLQREQVDDDTFPAVRVVEMTGAQLVRFRELAKPTDGCKTNHFCPLKNGVCCDGGAFCCPGNTKCAGSQRCARSSLEAAVNIARKKMEEEGQKQLDDEARRKKETESGQKAAEEEKTKNQQEAELKKKEEIVEAQKKAVTQALEQDKKTRDAADEQRTKTEEQNQKKYERKAKADKSREQEQLQKREAETEKRTKETEYKRQQEQREKGVASERSEKANEMQKKSEEAAEKDRQRKLLASQEQAEKTRDVITVRDETFRPFQNNAVASSSIIPYKGSYTFMFWVRVEGTQAGWANIIHKGSNDGERNAAVWLFPNGRRLHIRSGTNDNWNNGIDPSVELELWRWYHVAFSHSTRTMRVWLDGQQINQQAMSSPPRQNNGNLFASNPWYPPALVSLAELVYAPRRLPEDVIRQRVSDKKYATGQKREIKLKNWIAPIFNTRIATAEEIVPNRQFTYMFWVLPRNIIPHWANILHKGADNGQRNPAIWFYPGSTRLHIRSGNRGGGNDGVDPDNNLPLFKWTHVAVAHIEGKMTVWYDGRKVQEQNKLMPIENNGPLFVSDPWYPAAESILSDLRYYNYAVDDNAVSNVVRENKKSTEWKVMKRIVEARVRPQRNRVIATASAIPYSPSWTWMFWIKPGRKNGHWTNIMHKGRNDGERNPGIWFHPNSHMLHIRSGTSRGWNDGVHDEGPLRLKRKQWFHVAVSHQFNKLRVMINGEVRYNLENIPAPLSNQGDVYLSDNHYPAARCTISDMRYYNHFVKQDEVAEIFKANKY